jgi:hypothetical protein
MIFNKIQNAKQCLAYGFIEMGLIKLKVVRCLIGTNGWKISLSNNKTTIEVFVRGKRTSLVILDINYNCKMVYSTIL